MTDYSVNQMISEFDVPVKMRDGVVLRANIYRPNQEGKWPVLLHRHPYNKDNPPVSFGLYDISRAVRQGYVVIVQDTRGRFASEGDWELFSTSQQEASDTVETIRWASTLPFSNGKVGSFGESYSAFVQWAGMLQHPHELKAAAPSFSWSDPFDGLIYRGGALELGFLSYWQLGMYLDTLSRIYADEQERAIALAQLISDIDQLKTEINALPLKNFAPFARNKVAPAILQQFERGMDQDDVDALSLKGKYDKFTVPTLNMAGWYDIFLQGTIENFLHMRNKGGSPEARQSKLVIGPWVHLDHSHQAGEVNFGLAASSAVVDLVGLQLRWFDHFLKGKDTGILNEAPVKLFVMGENVWRDEYEWPLARTIFTPYYLHSQGHANTLLGDGVLSTIAPDQEAADHYTYDPGRGL